MTPEPGIAYGATSCADPLGLHPVTVRDFAMLRTARPDYFAWLDHIQAAAACTRPIRLVGHLYTVQRGSDDTARVLGAASTEAMPDGIIYKACGNRRAAVCPACARTYQRDAYQIIRAGLVGGKTVPATVAGHPAVFATFTAPSFGPVHTRHVGQHTCANRRRCDCRPDPCHARRTGTTPGLCPHGRPAVCWTRHTLDDPNLGRPLCLDCYDHAHQVVWNAFVGELWRRTKQAIERHLATLARHRGIPTVAVGVAPDGGPRLIAPVRVAHSKAAEFQVRGVVHFHVLLRLDGVDPHDPVAVAPPPPGFTTADLDQAVQVAARTVAFTTPHHPDRPGGWPITWGEQLDVRPIGLTGQHAVTDSMVAGYLAKYATKSTEATGHRSTRLDLETIKTYADPRGDHIARLIHACWRLGRHPEQRRVCPNCGRTTRLGICPHCHPTPDPGSVDTYVSTPAPVAPSSTSDNRYGRLRRWAHMLGFGGHFLTKARRYSVTFQYLRDTRIAYRRRVDHPDVDPVVRSVDHTEETTLVVGLLTYAGSGWHTIGDAVLANTSAAQARARQQAARDELGHEIGTAYPGAAPAAA